MRIAVVTGASSGLGRTFALQITKLYKNLDEIWVIARREERLLELREKLSVPVRIFAGDLYQDPVYEEIRQRLETETPDIRMLVNAAGFGLTGSFADLDLDRQLQMIDLNCKSLTRMTGICLPYLSKGSRLIQIASAAAFGPQPGFAVYAASKAYVYSFSYALRRELKARGIVVTAVCPGPVDTEFFDHTGSGIPDNKKAYLVSEGFVVKQALKDARDGKAVSIPGLTMKGARIASRLVPEEVITDFMSWDN